MVAEGADRLKAVLAQRGGGSLLRGWRRELDPDGSLDVSFREFCEAAARLGVSVDAEALFGLDSPESLDLEELAAPEGQLVERFREWLTRRFGGPGEMFMAFENGESAMEPDGKLHLYEFTAGLEYHGFEATEGEVQGLFQLLDMEDIGYVELEDVMFLETDKKRREGAILKAKLKHRRQRERFLQDVYRADMTRSVPRTHRRALRGWQAAAVERLPAVVQERRLHWRRRMQERIQAAGDLFERHVRMKHGNGVRLWRQGLDPAGRFLIKKPDLARYCRSVNLDVDINCLWKALDQDGDEVLHLEEVGKQHAAALARFHAWARCNFGSCVAAWERLRAVAEPQESWRSDKTMMYAPFLKVLCAHGWPGTGGSPTGASRASLSTSVSSVPESGLNGMLCKALDFRGSGIVTLQDFQWLDTWSPPEFLAADPDPEAWGQLREKMLSATGVGPLAAWRLLLDTDDSNRASWPEFLAAARKVGFTGNVGGAWRYLDADTSGSITLQEYDSESADLLASFKSWIELNFGCVEFAFRSMDSDGSGSVCFSELKRTCHRLGYRGNVKQIFDSLDIDVEPGKRTLSFKELAFLDNWVPEVEPVYQDDSTMGIRSAGSSRRGSRRASAAGAATTEPLMEQHLPRELHRMTTSMARLWPEEAERPATVDGMRRTGSCPSGLGRSSRIAGSKGGDTEFAKAAGHHVHLPSMAPASRGGGGGAGGAAADRAPAPLKKRRPLQQKRKGQAAEVVRLLPIASADGGQRLVSLLSPPR